MSQPGNDNYGAYHNGGNGDGDGSSRALLVRETPIEALAPYGMAGPGVGYIDSQAAQINPSQLLHALRRRWLLALCAGLMIAGPLAALVWLVTPANYEVEAILRVGDDAKYLGARGGSVHRNTHEYEAFRKTQAMLIKSPTVLRAALARPGISNLETIRGEDQAETFLSEELAVSAPMESEVLRIRMAGENPQDLMKIVDAVTDAYFETIVDADRTGKLRELTKYQQAYNNTMADLRRKQDQRKNLLLNTGVPNSEELRFQVNLLSQQSQAMLQQINNVRLELNKVETQIAVLEKRLKEGYAPPDEIVELAIGNDPHVRELTLRLTQLEQYYSIERSRSKYPNRAPHLNRIQSEIDVVRQQRDERRATIRPHVVEQVKRELDGSSPDQLPQLYVLRDKLLEQLAEQDANLQEITKRSADLSKQSADTEAIEAEIAQLEMTAADLYQQVNARRIENDNETRVTRVQPAMEPEGTKPFMKYALTLFAGLAGFVLGSGAVVGVEYQARRVSTTTDLGAGIGLRVLGTVPNVSAMSRSRNGRAAVLQGLLAESVDSIRTMLLQQTKENAPRVVMITSAGDHEGKTTVASHLAASLARSGRRTLLVDCDIRSPSAHAMFDLASEPGLCEVLRGELAAEAAIQPTPVEGLMMIAGGQCDYQCIAALAKSQVKTILDSLREQFDFIVLDGAPVLTYADTLLIGAHADAAILSVRRDVSQMAKVQEARDRLDSVGIQILGAVVNGINETSRRPAFALPAPA